MLYFVKILKKNVFNYLYTPYDKETLDRLEHNHNHFYNKDVIYKGIQEQFINPVKEWIEKG